MLLADRGYDADRIQKNMDKRKILAQTPMGEGRKMRVGVEHSPYSLQNLVDRCFSKLNNARRAVTCYDKTAESVLGVLGIMSIRPWTPH